MGEFRQFIARGNVLDLAVAVIIGAAFATIVSSLTDDVIMPVVGALFGGLDFSNYYLRLGPLPEGYAGPMSYAALKAAGVPMLGYGQFVTVVVNFLILAFIIFRLVKAAGRIMRKEAQAPSAPPMPSEDILLLREIRDALRARPGN
ncbi:MAG TPA: large conductance mechanosensitive channel protein MscL [Allosphingosinicella sp.]|jgi:large conductance mechanosensitive channel